MCNAWNHSSNCPCGFGGSGSGGLRIYNLNTINDFLHNSRLVGKAKFKYQLHSSIKTEEAETYPRKCWWCGDSVFYHTNGYGDTVLFDSLGKPWQVHSCWTQYWEEEKEKRKKYELCYPSRKFDAPLEKPLVIKKPEEVSFFDFDQTRFKHDIKLLIFLGAIQSIKSAEIALNEYNLAAQMGISIEDLQLEYGHFYRRS